MDDYRQTHYQLLFDQELGAHTTLNITGFRVDGAGFFESFEDEADLAFFGIGNPVIGGDTLTNGDLVQRRWLDNTLLGVNASVTHAFGQHRLIVGGSYSDYVGDHFGEAMRARYAGDTDIRDRYYENDARKTDANAFAKLSYSVNERLQLFGDVQVRQVNYDFLGFDDELDNVTPERRLHLLQSQGRGGLHRAIEGGRVYASVAANREPNRDDFTETTPESRPTSEQLIDYEAGYERRSGRLAVGVNGYHGLHRPARAHRRTERRGRRCAPTCPELPHRHRAHLGRRLTQRLLWKGNATWSRNRIRNFTEFVDDWDSGEQLHVHLRRNAHRLQPRLDKAANWASPSGRRPTAAAPTSPW